MQLLIALLVFITGFMVFGSIFYGIAKFFFGKKLGNQDLTSTYSDRNKSINLKVNRSHNVYSFK
jgi:hypothetical protein